MLTYIWLSIDFHFHASLLLEGHWKYSNILADLAFFGLAVDNLFG